MDTIPYTDLLEYIINDVPGCPEPLVIQEIQKLVINWCRETQTFALELDPVNLVKDETDYDVILTTGKLAVERVSIVETKAAGVAVTARRQRRRQRPFIDFVMAGKTTIRFQSPTAGDVALGLVVTVILRPLRTSTEICSRLFEDWFEAWADGVKSKLLKQPKKDWTDYELGTEFAMKYKDWIRRGRAELNRGFMNSDLMVDISKGFIL